MNNNFSNKKYLNKQEKFGNSEYIKKIKTGSGENALHFLLIGEYLSNIIYNPNDKTRHLQKKKTQ
jgi:hypothetical protein